MPSSSSNNSEQNSNDHYRPRYHFSAVKNWINDPNGMVYYEGEYHLFFQYHPDSMVWGPMHWGHAVSRDLVNWEHLPIALYPDKLGTIFSGSAVIDYANTAGFGAEAMVAIFTHNHEDNNTQSQSLAYSLDRGRSWTKYPANPIIPPQHGVIDFRDPKVFWYSGEDGSGHWVMCLVSGTAVLFYNSDNLIDWQMSGRFGGGYGSVAGVWETPEFFKVKVKDSSSTYWVLSVGVLEGGPAGGTGTQYFVGNFDGYNFLAFYEKETVLWADHGADFYAVQSWNNEPNGRRIWLAWMNNWQYGKLIPTGDWRGAMTIPREVGLIETANGPRLIQSPVRELEALRGQKHHRQQIIIQPDTFYSPNVEGESLEIIAEFELLEEMDAEVFGVRVRADEDNYTAVGFWTSRQMVYTNRLHSGNIHFHEDFPKETFAPIEIDNGLLRMHLFVDCCSLELFVNDGVVCFTNLIFPKQDSLRIELFSQGGPVTVRSLTLYKLAENAGS